MRIYPDEEGLFRFGPGDYGKDEKGVWRCRPPIPDHGTLGDLSQHQVTEHEDGTITVSPSILIHYGPELQKSWHGFLEKGVWRTV